jgi:hypothetical protein
VRFAVLEWLRGIGTIDVVLAVGASFAQRSAVITACEANRPLGIANYYVRTAIEKTCPLTITYSGVVSEADLSGRITALFGRLLPGEGLHRSRVESAAIESGAPAAEMTSSEMVGDTIPGVSSDVSIVYQLALGTLTIVRE